jgi:dTDP-4-dehydrorhamnose 3,5-epimerase
MDGVTITPLKQIHNPKGDIYHALKKSDAEFSSFGEAYFSTVHAGDIKGWKKHNRMTLNLVVPVGSIEFVIYNGENFTSVILSATENYKRLTVSPGLWMAFRGVGSGQNLLLNIASIEHDPDEGTNCDLDDIAYGWQ